MNENLTREQKIEKVIREGHEIAEKLKKAKNLDDLDHVEAEAIFFKKYVNSELGKIRTYEPYIEGKEKFSQLSFELSMAIEKKERQLIYYPDQTETVKETIEQTFENYLENGDWHSNRTTKF